MKIAVFSDIHSNLLALEAVLRDIEAREIDQIYCAGDLVGYGPRPNEVIELLHQREIPTLMGNYDDAIGNMRFICGCDYKNEEAMKLGEQSILWTKQQTTEANKKWLRELPQRIEFTAAGIRFLIVHGSPRQLNEYLFEDTPLEHFNKLLIENNCDVLICGHTHLPYYKSTAHGHIINVGSAGKPKHGNPNALYALVDVTDGILNVNFTETPYNYEETAKEIEEFGLPQEFAQIVRTGQ